MKASRWEILGAWLHIWTPPRDVDIPPVPRRAAAILAASLVAAVAFGLLVIKPAVDESKQRAAAQEERRLAASARRARARLSADQRARHGRATEAARLYAARRPQEARAALLSDVRAGVLRDARARFAAGTFDAPVRSVRCRYGAGPMAPRVRIDCFAITTRTAAVTVGQPFVAIGSLRDGRFAWCHENPRPGEGATGRGIAVALPGACTA